MKAKNDHSFQETSAPKSDPTTSFDRLWREVEKREKRQVNADPSHHRMRLACTGELVDTRSVSLVVSRESALGTVLNEFVCPRCGELHESRLFP